MNIPFPNEFMPESNRRPPYRPIAPPIFVPTLSSPSHSTVCSPAPSTLFSPLPPYSPFSSPPTSTASSPCTSPSLNLFNLRHGQRDQNYRRVALLHQLLPKPPNASSGLVSRLTPVYEEAAIVIPTSPHQSPTSRQVFPSRQHLTPCRELRNKVKKTEQYPFAYGGSADLYKGELQDYDGRVVIKVLRLHGSNDSKVEAMQKLDEHFDRESKLWTTLHHRNVLPLLGISRDFGPFPALVSPFCPFLDMEHYLRRHPHVDKKPILNGFTDGLRYLHSRDVIHGDFKPQNVVIDLNGEPLICDFGVSKIIDCQGFTTRFVGTPSFMAPELFPNFDRPSVLDEDAVDNDVAAFNPKVTKETDVFAYGLVALQMLTNKERKFRYFVTPKAQLLPSRKWYDPELTMNDQIWDLFKTCCDFDPERRPTIDEVMPRIHTIDW